ncbi:phage holin family protein [Pseudochryseolinea flava]|uniref:Phage holin family protein n=1 Tax=Pseudochryseolinea flava TaxID=2059302 RepID=A0A364Y4M9_9BACT|nr:phage holin family protein [Pseudochryseolinea flava]RAW01773.1 phage holin family protein [Pseudochryseolinea flava]
MENNLNDKANLKDKAEDLTEDIGDYLETYYQLKVLQITDKAANVASISMASLAVIVLMTFMFLFLGIALGLWIGESLNNMVAGFAIVAGAYALLALIVIGLRKNVVQPFIRNSIIKKTYG